MRIGVGPTRKKKISNQEGKEKRKKKKKKRNKRGKEFSRCTSNQIVLTISSEIPPGNNGKSHWKGSLALLLVNESLAQWISKIPVPDILRTRPRARRRKMGVAERRKRRGKKKKKIRQKWPDVDNPSGYPPLVAEENESKLKKRRKKRGREGRDEQSEEERRGCRWKMDDARFAEQRRDTTPRSGRRLILFWKLGLAWPWQTRHLQIVYGDGPYPCATLRLSPLSHAACLEKFLALWSGQRPVSGITAESCAFLFLAFINWPGYLWTPIESQGWAFNKTPRYRSSIF